MSDESGAPEEAVEGGLWDSAPFQPGAAYDPGDIDERFTYTVFVKIETGGSLIYITDTAYPVITNGAPTENVEVVVVPTG